MSKTNSILILVFIFTLFGSSVIAANGDEGSNQKKYNFCDEWYRYLHVMYLPPNEAMALKPTSESNYLYAPYGNALLRKTPDFIYSKMTQEQRSTFNRGLVELISFNMESEERPMFVEMTPEIQKSIQRAQKAFNDIRDTLMEAGVNDKKCDLQKGKLLVEMTAQMNRTEGAVYNLNIMFNQKNNEVNQLILNQDNQKNNTDSIKVQDDKKTKSNLNELKSTPAESIR